MADYDFSKSAPDRSHWAPTGRGASEGSGMGGVGFIIVGVIVLVVLYAVFGGAGVPLEQDPSAIAPTNQALPTE